MGGVKESWFELQSKGLASIPDKHICNIHFDDEHIVNFIKENKDIGFCSYCENKKEVVSFRELMDFIMEGISNFYEDAANYMSYDSREGGYLGKIYTPDELIQELIGLRTDPFKVTEDIVDSIDNIAWSEPEMYFDTLSDQLEFSWSSFKNRIKHESRYLFTSYLDNDNEVFDVLEEVGTLIKKLDIIETINSGEKLFRCRQHDNVEDVKTVDRIVAPPIDKALFSNRFSPSGISMLYTAFDQATAIKETVDESRMVNSNSTIAELEITKHINVVNFSKLPPIPSVFGVKNKDDYYSLRFLHAFVRDISQEILKDGKEHIEYVPTQVMTEFIRYQFNSGSKHKISGIVYPSSKNRGKNATVIFWDNKECQENLSLCKIWTKGTKEIIDDISPKVN